MSATSAKVFSDSSLAKDVIRFSGDNPGKFKKGDKVLITHGAEFSQFGKVELIVGHVATKDLDHIHSSKWTGTQGESVECSRISELRYAWNLVYGSPKLKIGFILTLVLIGSSYLNAAITKEGVVQLQLGKWRWILFAFTVASAIGTWAKDLW